MGRSRRLRSEIPLLAPSPNRTLLIGLYAVSGFCVLALETIWIRTLSNQMGGTAFSSSVIIGVYFVFAALGNLWMSRRLRRSERAPRKLYGWCELACALAALVCFLLRPWAEHFVNAGLDASVLRHFVYAAGIIGAPSFFSGAAFPALSQVLAERCEQRVSAVGPVYAGNLAGAALGVLLGGVALPQYFGYSYAFAIVCATLACVGLIAVRVAQKKATLPLPQPAESSCEPAPRGEVLGVIVLISSGVLSILLEILSIAYVRQFTAHSMYSVAAVLFAFIVNFGIGSWLAARVSRGGNSARQEFALAMSLAFTGQFCVVATLIFQGALHAGMPIFTPYSVGSIVLLAMGATLILAPLQIPAGMVFPLAWTLVKRRAARQGDAFGQIVAWNKIGSAAGAFIGPFILFSLIGLAGTLLAAGAAYLALGFAVALHLLEISRARRMFLAGSAVSMTLAAFAFFGRRAPVDFPASGKLIATYEGADGVVAVTEDATRSRHIVVNNSYVLNGTERALASQQQESWIPLLLCSNPQRVAFIGMASGISASAALDFPIKNLDAIELVPEVTRAARDHFGAWNARLFSDPRARVCINDGRFVIQSSTTPYDLIICDLFLPGQEGTSSLYSREFLASARQKLSAGGKFCLWLPLYQLDRELGSIAVRTFLEVFPNAIAMRGNMDPLQPTLALIGSGAPIDLSSEFLLRQLESPPVQRLSGDCPFFRSLPNARLLLVGDLRAVAAEFQSFELNRDDYPVFAFKGPREIPPDELLHGFGFLNWLGQRFVSAPYPSCALGETKPDELLAGIRAGNYFYAASINSLRLPVSPEKQLERARNSLEQLETACRISPCSDLKETELGR
jgi:spermidine synthase